MQYWTVDTVKFKCAPGDIDFNSKASTEISSVAKLHKVYGSVSDAKQTETCECDDFTAPRELVLLAPCRGCYSSRFTDIHNSPCEKPTLKLTQSRTTHLLLQELPLLGDPASKISHMAFPGFFKACCGVRKQCRRNRVI